MKKIISYAGSLLIIASVAAAPGSKVIQAFNETFPNAQNVKWNDDKAGYFVSFYENGNFEKVLYTKDGNFDCSWKYSDGKDLPVNIVIVINKKYSGGKITGVTELTTQDNDNYEVELTKGSKLYVLDISANGSIAKEERYTNPNADDAAVN